MIAKDQRKWAIENEKAKKETRSDCSDSSLGKELELATVTRQGNGKIQPREAN
jgi:hypothetical protein